VAQGEHVVARVDDAVADRIGIFEIENEKIQH
jgi:hypothetical protein